MASARTPLRRKSNGITPKRAASAALFVFDEDLREGVSTYIEAFANRVGGKFADWLRLWLPAGDIKNKATRSMCLISAKVRMDCDESLKQIIWYSKGGACCSGQMKFIRRFCHHLIPTKRNVHSIAVAENSANFPRDASAKSDRNPSVQCRISVCFFVEIKRLGADFENLLLTKAENSI